MKTKIINKIFVYLIISLVFIIPLNIGSSFAADQKYEYLQTKKEVSTTCSITPPINVKDSLILSIVTMCIPGILEKLMEWKEIKCEMAVCSYDAVINNLDPAFCKKQASYKTCKYVMGEIFAIPPLAIIEYLRDFIAGILANPVGIAFGVGVKLARNYVSNTCITPSPSCTSPVIGTFVVGLAIVDILAVFQTFKDMFENGFKGVFNFGSDSKCGQLSEIREELEGLVQNE